MYVKGVEPMNSMLIRTQCFKFIVQNPPRPLTEEDIWFQIGHVHEQRKDVGLVLPLWIHVY